MRNIYVGNLSPTITEQALREMFQAFGTVISVRVVADRDSGAPRGFAFIEMSDDADATNAIAASNGQVVDGRPISVSEARAKTAAPAGIHRAMRRHRDHRF